MFPRRNESTTRKKVRERNSGNSAVEFGPRSSSGAMPRPLCPPFDVSNPLPRFVRDKRHDRSRRKTVPWNRCFSFSVFLIFVQLWQSFLGLSTLSFSSSIVRWKGARSLDARVFLQARDEFIGNILSAVIFLFINVFERTRERESG